MKKLIISAICALGLGSGAHAATATFDFVTLANTVPGESVVEGSIFSNNGLQVLVTSSNFAYLDSSNSNGDAGLGVCKSGSGCAGTNDDNINAGESVTLTFSHLITQITSVSFNDANHFSLNGSSDQFTETFNITNEVSFAAANGLTLNAFSDLFQYTAAYFERDFYIASITVQYDEDRPVPGGIPLPAGLPLMLGALAAFGLARRRKSA